MTRRAERRRARGVAVQGLTLGLLLATGCWGVRPPAPSSRPAPPPEPVPGESIEGEAATDPAATILSAHVVRVDDPELDGLDAVLVVFSHELDAMSVRPRVFVVSRAQQGPVWPEQARLSPASESDENRSVMLVGDFGGAADGEQPTHVAVSGRLFGEDGRRLTGLGATISPFAAPPRVVAADLLEVAPGRCEGGAVALRTYWSAELRGVDDDDRERVQVLVQGVESPRHPTAFDDHRVAHQEAGQDNVLDLCLAEAEAIREVRVEAGAFRDVAGHASDAVDLRLDAAEGS